MHAALLGSTLPVVYIYIDCVSLIIEISIDQG